MDDQWVDIHAGCETQTGEGDPKGSHWKHHRLTLLIIKSFYANNINNKNNNINNNFYRPIRSRHVFT